MTLSHVKPVTKRYHGFCETCHTVASLALWNQSHNGIMGSVKTVTLWHIIGSVKPVTQWHHKFCETCHTWHHGFCETCHNVASWVLWNMSRCGIISSVKPVTQRHHGFVKNLSHSGITGSVKPVKQWHHGFCETCHTVASSVLQNLLHCGIIGSVKPATHSALLDLSNMLDTVAPLFLWNLSLQFYNHWNIVSHTRRWSCFNICNIIIRQVLKLASQSCGEYC